MFGRVSARTVIVPLDATVGIACYAGVVALRIHVAANDVDETFADSAHGQPGSTDRADAKWVGFWPMIISSTQIARLRAIRLMAGIAIDAELRCRTVHGFESRRRTSAFAPSDVEGLRRDRLRLPEPRFEGKQARG